MNYRRKKEQTISDVQLIYVAVTFPSMTDEIAFD